MSIVLAKLRRVAVDWICDSLQDVSIDMFRVVCSLTNQNVSPAKWISKN